MNSDIAILGTLDTKGQEVAYMKMLIERAGHSVSLIDIGSLGPPELEPDVDRNRVAQLAGWELEELLKTQDRDQIMAAMGRGSARVLLDLLSQEQLAGVIALGGNQGSAVASMAMRALPLGFPKFLVSTVASSNLRPYIGHKDIVVVFSVSDLLGGPNSVTRSILANAVAAVVGMVEHGQRISVKKGEPTVAISALGNTQQGVNRALELLRAKGYQVIAFHASGAGGSAMEELIETGVIHGVLDMTLHELTEEVVGAGAYIPVKPGRLNAAALKGIPQVVAPGGMEYLCFGPKESIPFRFRKRKIYMHNPYNANVKASRSEMARVGQVMAERLNGAQGPTAVMIPIRGWSVYGSQGGPLYDPVGNRKLVQALQQNLAPKIKCTLYDAHLNDPEFAQACVDVLLEEMNV